MKVRLLRRWRFVADRFPLRTGGVMLLSLLAAVFYWYGVRNQDLILLLGSACVFIVALLTVVLVTEAAITTGRRVRRSSALREGNRLQWMSGHPGWLPLDFRPPRRPLVEVVWRWVDPQGAKVDVTLDAEGCVEQVTLFQRCLLDRVVREFEVRDVLGVCAIRWQTVQTIQLEVLPEALPVDQSTLVYSLHGGDDQSDPFGDPVGDRVDMRRYAAGDPPRLILWKVFARSRKLMVRHPERAFSPTPRTCAYLVSGPLDEGSAGLVRHILESGMLGSGWRFGADGNADHTSNVPQALTFLARSGNRTGEATQIGPFLDQAKKDGYQSCLVVLPAAPGPWIEQVQGAVKRAGLNVTFLTVRGGAAHVKRTPGPEWWEKMRPFLVAQEAQEAVGDPERVLERFLGQGRATLMYERSGGVVRTWKGKAARA